MEAPATIKRLRDDLLAAKTKIKSYYSQIGEDASIIKTLYEEKSKLHDQLVHLKSLVNNLGEREALQEKLKQSNQKITELQSIYSESEKRLEIVDKNLTTDNKHLRARVLEREKESQRLKKHLMEIEEKAKEKDKLIASLSIYRYNALHKKPELPPPCKPCLEREKVRIEEMRIAAIKG
jgi:chromosome segregation ATPase